MDHELGGINLIRWQGRRNRRAKAGVSIWAVFLATCALVGCSTLTAQVFGLLPWSGLFAPVPALLVLAAVSTQLVAVGRAALVWLKG